MSSYDDGVIDGQTREQVREHGRRLDAMNGSIDRAEQAISGLREDVKGIGVKVGIYAAIAASVAAIVGSAASGLIIYIITN